MVEEGRAIYADPSSIMRAAVMLLRHIGFVEKANKLEMALDICGQFEHKVKLTGKVRWGHRGPIRRLRHGGHKIPRSGGPLEVVPEIKI